MKTTLILVIGKRGGILKWYENILDIDTQSSHFKITGFALNHNNWQERTLKKLLKFFGKNVDIFTANQLDRAINSTQPDIILIVDLFYLCQNILSVLEKNKPNTKIYHWIGDFFDARLKNAAPIIDHYFFTDSTFIDDACEMGIKNTSFLPLATNPKIFKQTIPFEKKKSRLLFVGAYSKSRQSIINQIDFPMTIIGKGWHQLKSNNKNLKIYSKNINIHQVAELYDQHKYIFNAINKNNTRQGLTMRCFDVQACGSLLITEYSPDLAKITLDQYFCFNEPSNINGIIYQLDQNTTKTHSKPNDIISNSYSSRLHKILKKFTSDS